MWIKGKVKRSFETLNYRTEILEISFLIKRDNHRLGYFYSAKSSYKTWYSRGKSFKSYTLNLPLREGALKIYRPDSRRKEGGDVSHNYEKHIKQEKFILLTFSLITRLCSIQYFHIFCIFNNGLEARKWNGKRLFLSPYFHN